MSFSLLLSGLCPSRHLYQMRQNRSRIHRGFHMLFNLNLLNSFRG
jgi:hypothetical protein